MSKHMLNAMIVPYPGRAVTLRKLPSVDTAVVAPVVLALAREEVKALARFLTAESEWWDEDSHELIAVMDAARGAVAEIEKEGN